MLEISTAAGTMNQPAVNAMTSGAAAALGIALHIHDGTSSPGMSSLTALPYFSSQPFQYGVDVFMPAVDPPNGVITLKNIPRGDTTKPQVLNVPNWASSKHHIAVNFSDFPIE